MTGEDARADEIVRYIELIAPSEKGAVGAMLDPEAGTKIIAWNLLPPDVSAMRLVVAAVEDQGFVSVLFIGNDDEQHPVGESMTLATFAQSDDEVAHEIVVHGAQVLYGFRMRMLETQQLQLAQLAGHFYDLIQEGLKAWGAGAVFEGVSPRLQPGPGSSVGTARPVAVPSARSAGAISPPQLVSPEIRQIRALRGRTWLWIGA